MSDASHTQLTGPDLTAGIPSHSLQEDTPLLGHAYGEAVLVARSGGTVYAIGATCTHYGGPLSEGLLVGDTVRCPWHHACFSLRTGEALHAPALDPVSCFEVQERDGTLRVGARIAHAVPDGGIAPVTHTAGDHTAEDPPRSIVIVGAGAAGVAAADMLRRRGYDGALHLIDGNDTYPVDRPNLSKDYLAGHAPEAWVNLRSEDYYAQHDIDLMLGTRVARLDVAGRAVETDDGRRFSFDRLLLATGATPVHLNVPGHDLPHVHYLRTLADSRAIIAAATRAQHAVVVGASFIGLEVAASLRARGIAVHVVAPEERPLQRVLGAELGDMVRALHESHGVIFHLGDGVAAIEAEGVRLNGGATLAADLVVAGIGVRPDVTLAERAGLAVDNGVLVDEVLQSSVPGIFAAGDIARWPDRASDTRVRVEHWVVAERQGQCAARNMLGERTPYTAVPFFWSRHYDLSVEYVGHAERWDRVTVEGDLHAHDGTVTYYQGDTRRAVATVSREMVSLRAEHAMEQRVGNP